MYAVTTSQPVVLSRSLQTASLASHHLFRFPIPCVTVTDPGGAVQPHPVESVLLDNDSSTVPSSLRAEPHPADTKQNQVEDCSEGKSLVEGHTSIQEQGTGPKQLPDRPSASTGPFTLGSADNHATADAINAAYEETAFQTKHFQSATWNHWQSHHISNEPLPRMLWRFRAGWEPSHQDCHGD